MSLFGNKKKNKVEWSEKTAPKEMKLLFKLNLELKGISQTDSYGNDANISKVNAEKYLNLNTDGNREAIKQEIQDKLESVYLELCELIDSNNCNFSDEFWADSKLVENNLN